MSDDKTRNRFLKAFAGGLPDDRLPVIEWASWWDKTLVRWRSEGLPEELDSTGIKEYFGLDIDLQFWAPQCIPAPPSSEPGQPPQLVNSEYFESIREQCAPRIDENLRNAWREAALKQQSGSAVVWATVLGFFWWPRTLFGIEKHLYAFYDQPRLMHRMNECNVEFAKTYIAEMCRYCRPDFVTLAEDMSYNHGPMLSRSLFFEFLAPYYRQLIPFLKELGITVIVDSDGDVEKLIPWLMEVGVDGILPLERQAGVDLARVKSRYPEFKILGGFDKMVMNQGEAAIRGEFERMLPVMRMGGYIPSVDHQTPPGVSIDQYRLYVSLLKEYAARACEQ